MQFNKKGFFTIAAITLSAAIFSACGSSTPTATPGGKVDPGEAAAKVNGKVITMEEVDRAVKQQAQGQESKLSPLELAGARLQVLQSLIEQEVMFQKAEKEGTVPSDDDVTTEINKQKTQSGKTSDQLAKEMKEQGITEASLRDSVKKGMAIQKLVEKVTGKVETPSDREIEEFFKSNPEMFVRKRGVALAAIVVDPTDAGQGDTTRNESEASQKVKEILAKVQQPASDFAALAREYSEDPSRFQGGDLGYLSEDDLKRSFNPEVAAAFMNPQFAVGQVTNMVPVQGKGYIFKLKERIEKEENLTLDSPQVRPEIQKLLVDNRKQLLAASYQAIAMSEAKIENLLAQKVVTNPNELSGSRPAGAANAATPAANANTAAPANTANANTNSNAAPTKPAANANANAKPANANK